MNPFFARIPLVKLLVPFLLGIAASYSYGLHVSLFFFLLILAACTTFIALHRRLLHRSLNWSGVDGVLIALAFFFTGAGITSLKQERAAFIAERAEKPHATMLVRLLKDPVVKEKSVKLCVLTVAVSDSNGWSVSGEKLMLYLSRNEAAEKLRYGDELLTNAKPQRVEGPKNPGEFDYRVWLERKEIYRQSFVKSGQWQLVARNKGNFFTAFALDLRRYFLGKLQEYGVNGAEGGVAAALLLGSSDQLDPGLLQAYSASGTLHVLSVSGMHVALVYVVLLRLLAPLEKRRHGKWASFFIQLVFLWFYATLTGLCPSVLRSVTMLSVVIAGKAFGRQAHILNSLAASALILLLLDPLLLYDVGFQLSYLAVAGIVLLQPALEKHWEPKLWLTRQVWSLVTVTLAAQVFTFPLGLYYFRQFPTYFLLSNLVVIPLSTLTMYAGLVLLIVSPFKIIGRPVAWVFILLVKLLNLSVQEIEQLPCAVMQSSGWKTSDLIFLYALVIGAIVFLFRRKGRWLNFAFACCFLLLTSFVRARQETFGARTLVIFHVNHATAIGIVNGDEALLFADSTLVKKEGDIDFHVHPFFERNGCYDEQVVLLSDTLAFRNGYATTERSWLRAAGKNIFLAGKNTDAGYANGPCDILLLRQGTRMKLDSLIDHLHPKQVVADGSDSRYKTAKWKTICEKRNVPFYDVKEKGALVIEEKK